MQGSFEHYEDRLRSYGSSWFESDSAATTVIASHADIRAQVYALAAGRETVGTEVLYRAGGRWLSDRKQLHEELVARALSDRDDLDGVPGTDVPHDKRKARQAVLLLGLPGSGKSSTLRPIAHELISRVSIDKKTIVDPDHVRYMIPEYGGGLGSEVVQAETSYIANHLLIEKAIQQRANVVIDKVGDPKSTSDIARYLTREGWSVWCLCTSLDPELAIERAMQRAVETGRYVPPQYIRDVAWRPVQAYDSLQDPKLDLTGSALLNTDVPPGSPPKILHAAPERLFGAVGEDVAVWPAEGSADESALL